DRHDDRRPVPVDRVGQIRTHRARTALVPRLCDPCGGQCGHRVDDSVAGVLAVPTRRGRVLCRVLDALHHFFGIQVRIHGAYECGDSADVGCRVTGALDFRGLSFVDHAVRQALRLRSGIERQDFGPGRGDIDPGAV